MLIRELPTERVICSFASSPHLLPTCTDLCRPTCSELDITTLVFMRATNRRLVTRHRSRALWQDRRSRFSPSAPVSFLLPSIRTVSFLPTRSVLLAPTVSDFVIHPPIPSRLVPYGDFFVVANRLGAVTFNLHRFVAVQQFSSCHCLRNATRRARLRYAGSSRHAARLPRRPSCLRTAARWRWLGLHRLLNA